MAKEGKIIIGSIVGILVVIVGLAFWLTGKSSGNSGGDSFVPNVQAENLEVTPSATIDLGNVAYSGGKVSKSFEIRNDSGQDIKLRKITTSCMCTTAKFSVNGKESKSYGMEMNGDLNPLISVDFPAGSTGQVIFEFDPAAHGPAGVGAFQRTVSLFFDSGYKDFNFQGTVVNN